MVQEFGLLDCTGLAMMKYLVRGGWMARGTGNGIYRAFHPEVIGLNFAQVGSD